MFAAKVNLIELYQENTNFASADISKLQYCLVKCSWNLCGNLHLNKWCKFVSISPQTHCIIFFYKYKHYLNMPSLKRLTCSWMHNFSSSDANFIKIHWCSLVRILLEEFCNIQSTLLVFPQIFKCSRRMGFNCLMKLYYY